MPSFVPALATLVPFLIAALTLNLTPGADMTYVIARSVGQGRVAGIVSAFGISAGSRVQTVETVVSNIDQYKASNTRPCAGGHLLQHGPG